MSSCSAVRPEEKRTRLHPLYEAFETAAAPYKKEAVCRKGCSYCCSDAGRIHITTLEGLVLRQQVERLARPVQRRIKKALAADLKRREQGRPSPCPFLRKNKTCLVYAVRPFVCRRIYSLKVCSSDQHPVVHRRVMAIGQQTICQLQRLDDTGYSGHLSCILHLFDRPAFCAPYLAGGYRPDALRAFGKRHGIGINRQLAGIQGEERA